MFFVVFVVSNMFQVINHMKMFSHNAWYIMSKYGQNTRELILKFYYFFLLAFRSTCMKDSNTTEYENAIVSLSNKQKTLLFCDRNLLFFVCVCVCLFDIRSRSAALIRRVGEAQLLRQKKIIIWHRFVYNARNHQPRGSCTTDWLIVFQIRHCYAFVLFCFCIFLHSLLKRFNNIVILFLQA